MTHSLPLYRRKKPGWHWRDVIKRQLRVEEALRAYVKSATIQPDPNT